MDTRDYPEAYLADELAAYGTRNHLLDKAATKIKQLRATIAELEKQRDELLAAIDKYLPETDHYSDNGVRFYSELLDVIEAIKGEPK